MFPTNWAIFTPFPEQGVFQRNQTLKCSSFAILLPLFMNKLVFLLNILFLCGCVSSLSLQSKKDNKTEVGIEQNINNEEYIIYSRCINEDLLSYFNAQEFQSLFVRREIVDHFSIRVI